MTKRVARLAMCVALVAHAGLSAVSAQQPAAQQQDANELFNTLMSPFCPGRLLANCPSVEAELMRGDVRRQLAAGATTEAVVDSLYAIYGDRILGAPRVRGFGLLAWAVPVLALVAGASLLAVWLRSVSRRSAAAVTPSAELDAESRARLESELSQL